MNLRCAVLGVALLPGCKDSDADGIRDGRDCAPHDHLIHPDAREVCNGADDDCNDQVDEGVSIVAYWDRDRDGYGDDAFARRVCALPEDGSPVGGDCDDLDPTVFPGAEELCDGRDGDCDGEPDAGAAVAWYPDADGDGHGVPGTIVESCTAPPGTAPNDDDCDDTEPLAWTGAIDVCDGVDNNCDGAVDEGLPVTRQWADADGDGYGDPDAPILACGPGRGASDNTLDCDDSDAAESPATIEVQGNGLDEDCDGWVDEYGVGPGNPYATVEAALAAAPDGAVVQLDAGFFSTTVDLTGRDVTFAGEGCGWTVLYADGAGSGVRIDAGALVGLTITGGTGTLVTDALGVDVVRGGGVLVEGNATLDRLCIEGNDAAQGGGLAVHAGDVVASDLTVSDNVADVGGGVFVAEGPELVLQRSRVVGNVSSIRAGGIESTGRLMITNSVVAGNTCVHRGCGIDIRGDVANANASVINVTLHANRNVGPVGVPPYSEALGVGGLAAAILTNVLVTSHPNALGSVVDSYVTVDEEEGTIVSSFLGFGSNAGSDYEGPTWELTRAGGDPLYVMTDPTLPPTAWDLRLRADSPYQDAGDPALLDPDGSPSDIGAFGGPGAPEGWDVGQTDADCDLLLDGWEIRFATNPWVDDAGDDPDLDGLTNLDEQLAGSDPHQPELDGSAPIADAGADRVVRAGDVQIVDAGASWDPDGDVWSAAWTLISAPAGSAAVVTDPTSVVASFAPDVPGTYIIALEVDDGQVVGTDTLVFRAFDGPVVPDDHPTVQEAIDAALDGDAVWIRPGRWDGPLVTSGREITLAGLGVTTAGDVIVDGHSAGSVVSHTGGGSLLLAHLTLTAGRATSGGGVHVADLDVAELYDVILSRNFADDGGALWAVETPLVVSDAIVNDNHAVLSGGGLWIEGTDIKELAVIQRTTFDGNSASETGGALHVAGLPVDTDVVLGSVACIANAAPDGACWWHVGDGSHLVARDVWLAGNTGDSIGTCEEGFDVVLSPVLERNAAPVIFAEGAISRVLQVFDAFLWANTVDEPADPFVDPAIPEANWSVDDPLSAFVDDGVPDDPWGLRLGSAAIDAGFIEDEDGDGTRADAGACGGPAAPSPCLRWPHDGDGDGLSDGWELAFGLDPTVPGASSDADGDGLTNLAEHAAGTRPDRADSDLDGVDDAIEALGSGDPRDDRDHRPTAAVADPDVIGSVGVPVALDASQSSDPDGDPVVVWSWTFLSTAPGSTLTDADIAGGAAASFVPDVPGTWQLGLVVTAGGASSRELVFHVTAL